MFIKKKYKLLEIVLEIELLVEIIILINLLLFSIRKWKYKNHKINLLEFNYL